MKGTTKNKNKSKIYYDSCQSQNNSNNTSSLSKKIYEERLNKNPSFKRTKEELSSFSENTDPIAPLIKHINDTIDKIISDLSNFKENFKEFSSNLKSLQTEDTSKLNGNTTKEKNSVSNLINDNVDEINNKIEELDKQINSQLESIKNKIEDINQKGQSNDESLSFTNNFTNKLDFENTLPLKSDELSLPIWRYNYFKPDENTLEIRIEIPGNVKINVSFKVVGDETIICVRGRKKQDTKPKEVKDNLYNIRIFDDIKLDIPLKTEKFRINQTKPNEGYPQFKNGICIIQYTLAPNSETVSADTEDQI